MLHLSVRTQRACDIRLVDATSGAMLQSKPLHARQVCHTPCRTVYQRPAARLVRRSLGPLEERNAYTSRTQEQDPFHVATARLQTLLLDSREQGDTLLNEIDGYPPETKLTLCTNVGTTLSVAAIFVCLLCGEDPLGGMTFSSASLDAGLVGLLCSVPLVVCSVVGHARETKDEFPVLDELYASQREVLTPWLSGLNIAQQGILLAFLVVPYLLLLLPAARGGLDTAAGFADDALIQPLLQALAPYLELVHWTVAELPEPVRLVAPAIFSSYLAGFVVASSLSVSRRQVSAIRDALRSADRYFRLTLAQDAGMDASPGSSSEEGSRSVAEAFRHVVVAWLVSKRRVAQLACILTSLNVAYYGLIWQYTNDLTTPAVAAFMHAAAEAWFVAAEQREAERRGRRVPVIRKPKGSQ